MRAQLGEMELGDILDRGVRILFSRFATFLVIAAVAFVPLIALQLLLPWLGLVPHPRMPGKSLAYSFSLLIAQLTLITFARGAILYVVAEDFAGRRVGAGAALGRAAVRFVPLTVAALSVGLVITGGTLLCCIPGIIVYIWFSFVGQTIIAENRGAFESLGRSKQLVDGQFWRVFAVVIVVTVITFVPQTIAASLGFVFPRFENLPGEMDPELQQLPAIFQKLLPSLNAAFVWPNHIMLTLIESGITIAMVAFEGVCMTLTYLDLRARKEGYDLEIAMGVDRPDSTPDRPET